MKPDLDRQALDRLRVAVRRRAFANLMLGLIERSRRTAGRLVVEPADPYTALLRYQDVRTIVRQGGLFRFATRDFAVLLIAPDLWPFEREVALQPFVLTPDDFAHPNSDGRAFCLDLRGVIPARIPDLLYDNLRQRTFRLDHCVDHAAAAFVRDRLNDVPADRRPLDPNGEAQ
jgi:hypothetical protein